MSLNEHLVDNTLRKLLEKILEERGVNLTQYKTSFLQRRLEIRLKAHGLQNYLQYASLLDKNPSEYATLFNTLSISVTEFFRDKSVFNFFITKIIQKLLTTASKQNEVRIWSAGCATGEESYSIAMLLKEILGNEVSFKVIGTDINATSIEVAKVGRYHKSVTKNLPVSYLIKYLRHSTKDGFYEVVPEIANSVSFNVGDITRLNPPAPLDVIFCRNILMYLEKDVQYKLIEKFFYSLRNTGYLILGGAETIIGHSAEFFEPATPKERIYHKRQS